MDRGGKEKTRHFVRLLLAWWSDHGRIWLGLCLLTLLLWQFRFVRCGPNLLPDRACESLEHWTSMATLSPGMAHADREGLVLTKRKNEPTFSLTRPLEGLEQVGYLAVTCDATWENAVPHPAVRWLELRVVIAGYDANNRFSAPMDHGVVSAHGSKGWHRVQTVTQLPVELKKVVLSIDGFGEEGVMRLRGLKVEPVRQRAWFVPATELLLGAWAWAFSRLLVTKIRGRWMRSRAFLIACGILFGAWFFVFPQGRTMFPSLIGDFVMGPEIASLSVLPSSSEPEKMEVIPQVPAQPIPGPSKPQPRLRTLAPPDPAAPHQQTTLAPKPPVSPPVTIAPQPRQTRTLGLWLRQLDRKWNWKKYNLTHFTAFFGIGFFVFGLAGSGRIWPLPFTIGFLGEIIPNLIYNTWDRGDWWDLSANLGGLLTAMILLYGLQKWRHKKCVEAPIEDSA